MDEKTYDLIPINAAVLIEIQGVLIEGKVMSVAWITSDSPWGKAEPIYEIMAQVDEVFCTVRAVPHSALSIDDAAGQGQDRRSTARLGKAGLGEA